ncbi:RNA-directed DNA polymerase from mobile element jockey, partial [Stegodyphus mimosarum]
MPIPLNSKIMKFADDTAILTKSIKPQLAIDKLEAAVNQITHYFNIWRMKINPSKCQILVFRRHKKFTPITINIKINNQPIPIVNSVKYLGVYFDSQLLFKDHVTHALQKAIAAKIAINALIHKKSKLSINLKRRIYLMLIRPVLLYAVPVWATVYKTYRKKLQIFQNKLLRQITDSPWFVRNLQLHKDLKIKPIADEFLSTCHNFYSRIEHSEFSHIQELINYDPTLEIASKRPRAIFH